MHSFIHSTNIYPALYPVPTREQFPPYTEVSGVVACPRERLGHLGND